MSEQNKRDAIKAAVLAAQNNVKTGVRAGIYIKQGPIFVKSPKVEA